MHCFLVGSPSPCRIAAASVPTRNVCPCQAFPSGGERGWGVRATQQVTRGQVVVEVRGRCLSETEYEATDDLGYVVSFDDKLLQLKRAAGDDVMYIDLRREVEPARAEPAAPTPPHTHTPTGAARAAC